MNIEKITDIELLIKSRLDYFANDSHMPQENLETLIANLRSYFEKHIPLNDFVCLAVKEADTIASVGFMVINEMPANGFAIEGMTGTLLNILPIPNTGKKDTVKL
ncbi:MAG: hypothetical protein LUF90_01195 [Rikenellaceae bacterium]|nr:hypothetical protein [Rikenellaceae bacterium]